MFGSVIIDVVIGLALVYLLLSLVSAAVREGIAGIFKTRSRFLHEGMRELLGDPSLLADLYRHPLISALYRDSYEQARERNDLPSYIPSRSFALALLDMAARGRDARNPLAAGPEAARLSLADVRQRVWLLRNEPVQRVLLTAIDGAGGDPSRAVAAIEHWFDSSMDRVSGWYKRRTQGVLFLVGLIVTIIADADTIRIANHLYRDPARRDAAVAIAGGVARDSALATAVAASRSPAGSLEGGGQPPGGPGAQPSSQRDDVARSAMAMLDSLGLPIAWAGVRTARDVPPYVLDSLLGWLITAFAISLGAPFWFEALNRLMVVRSTVKPREKSGEEASQDRQARAAPISAPVVVPSITPWPSDGAGLRAVPAPAAASPPVPPPPVPADPDFEPHEWESGHPQGGVL